MKWPLKVTLVIGLFAATVSALAGVAGASRFSHDLAVIYPRVEEPYFSIFQNILKGISQELGGRACFYQLASDTEERDIRKWTDSSRVEGVIALGKQGYLVAKSTKLEVPVVIGALPLAPNGFSGISLSPDPVEMLGLLHSLAPDIKKVYVVYSKVNEWLVTLARTGAKRVDIVLEATEVSDLKGAVQAYRVLLQKVQPGKDAIWLPLDHATADDDIVLPMLLQAAWEKEILLFSSKPSHAQRGVLFSVFPDYYKMGVRLAQFARKGASQTKTQVEPLTDLEVAVNLRTAAHLGLRFDTRQQENFDLIFPSR